MGLTIFHLISWDIEEKGMIKKEGMFGDINIFFFLFRSCLGARLEKSSWIFVVDERLVKSH